MNLYTALVRPILFRFDAESAHDATIAVMSAARVAPVRAAAAALCRFEDPRLAVEIAGLRFNNPIGLAAGLDKNCECLEAIGALGFGAIEAGTVTLKPQAGNPRPRITRFPADGAIINSLGFPSNGIDGSLAGLLRAKNRLSGAVLGINLVKNRDTELEQAADDYCALIGRLQDVGEFFTINVSSPNTPALRKLQEPDRLAALIARIRGADPRGRPVFLKLAPDFTEAELQPVIEVIRGSGIAAVVATNTTFSREGLSRPTETIGGMSGKPLFARSTAIVSMLYRSLRGAVPIIGVGGVRSAEDVRRMFECGAAGVQLYTALVYQGPLLVKRIKQDLARMLDRERIDSLAELTGRAVGR